MKKKFGDLAAEAGLETRTPEQMEADMLARDEDGKAHYLAANFSFLDRTTQKVKRAIAYPITRIELYSRMDSSNPTGKPTRVFVVSEDGGQWTEVTEQ